MLWTDVGPLFVDLEDCRMGPAVLDPWMMLSGNRSERALQLTTPREGDATLCPGPARARADRAATRARHNPLTPAGSRAAVTTPCSRRAPGFGTPQY